MNAHGSGHHKNYSACIIASTAPVLLKEKMTGRVMGSARTTVHTKEHLDRKDKMILKIFSAQRPAVSFV